MGYSARDAYHIVLTHLDFDHAGGLEDFPEARVHVMGAVRDAAERRPQSFIARRRHRPAQWDEVRDLRTMPMAASAGSVRNARALDGLPPEILMIPLPGHTAGHAGIAIRGEEGWVLNADDAYFYRRELDADRRRCTPGLRFYQRMMDTDRALPFANQERLREHKHGAALRIFCSHDAKALEAIQRGAGTAIAEIRPAPTMRPHLVGH